MAVDGGFVLRIQPVEMKAVQRKLAGTLDAAVGVRSFTEQRKANFVGR